jgi:hypothetical protein
MTGELMNDLLTADTYAIDRVYIWKLIKIYDAAGMDWMLMSS